MSRQKQHEKPQRSCLGCRQSNNRDALIRFVLSPQGEIVPDLEAKLPGRGAYTCVNESCLRTALKQRQFNRAFKLEVATAPPDEVVGQVGGIMVKRILGYMGLANKSGQVISGSSLVSDAIKSGHKPGLVLVATDVSESIGEKIELLATVHHVKCFSVLGKDDFGAILGKAPRSAVAIRTGGFVAQLMHEIERYRNFLGEVRNL